MQSLDILLKEVRACCVCKPFLPHGVRPVLQISKRAKILIVGQAPGLKVHQSGIPFDDASGDRLRQWMGIDAEVFYNQDKVAILPMGFCFPGSGKSGDLAPRKECAPLWRDKLLAHLPNVSLTLAIGRYAQLHHIKAKQQTLTQTVQNWQDYQPDLMPLPHPSPRNNIWLAKNPWFEKDLVPRLQQQVQAALGGLIIES